MKVIDVRTRNIGFSTPPETLRSNLVTPTSVFDDHASRPGGWFGDTVFTLVEVEADDGTIGVGSAGAFHGGAKAIIDAYYAGVVLGEDPRRHERLWQRMYRSTVRFGRSGSAVAALSAVDIAMWDLHGKAEGVAVYDLLGGRTQDAVPCYVSRLYALEDLDALAEEARRWVAAGFTRLKQRFGFGPREGIAGMRRNVELIATVRAAVGDDVELAADAYMGWDLGYAIQMADLLREHRLSWIEEPLMPSDLDGYEELKARCPWQRWSCGEHSYTKWDFAELIRRRAVDILQPDVNRTGGITETMKICALAETAGLPVVPHSNEPHNLAVIFSQSAHVCPVIEYFPSVEPDTGNELFWKAFRGHPVPEQGIIAAPPGPGLGVEIDEEAIERLGLAVG